MRELRPQKRGRRISMTAEERDAFLDASRTCRIATVDSNGQPHVSALWFVWDGAALWLNSVVRSQRWTNVMWNPKVSVLVDDGHDFVELRGVELIGTVVRVGEAPRIGEPCPELDAPEQAFGEKYADGQFAYDGGHAWLRLAPEKIVSWDFKKMAG